MRKGILFSIILIGFTAVAAQIILMREFLIVFYGNEISIGFVFTGWFICGMFGSWLLGRLADKVKSGITLFSLSQFSLSILLPLSILAIRSIKPVFNLGPGELTPLLVMFSATLVILAPVCMLLGFLFSLSAKVYDFKSGTGAGRIGMVYALEAVGSTAGGILVSFILIRLLNSLQIMTILSVLNISGAILLQVLSERRRARKAIITAFAVALAALIFLTLSGSLDNIERRSLEIEWRGSELLASRNSIYGNVAITKRGPQRSFFYDGLHLYTVPDLLTSEEAVHFALLEHPNPETVLLVGGGAGGLIKEILKHPVKRVDYVELDPIIIKMAARYLPEEEYDFLKDRRVVIKNIDGRLFVKETENKYDCVIVHLGDPYTAQLNRYYTVEFFREAKRILKDGGILSFALSSSESYMSRELKRLLGSVYASLRKEFSDVKVIPGDIANFLGCNRDGVLTYDYKILVKRIMERGIDAKYVREYYLFSRLSPEKIMFTEDSLMSDKKIKINYDFRPVAYYYDMIFRAAHFKDSLFKRMLEAATEKGIWAALFVACLFIVSFAAIKMKRCEVMARKAIVIAVMAIGFTQVAFQIVILLSFQIIYGYVFYKLGLIITSFMAGLALGGFWILKAMPKIKNDLSFLIRSQFAICIYALVLPAILSALSRSRSAAISWVGANIIFLLIPAVAGFIGGAQFPLANKIYLGGEGEVGRTAGLTYGMDLFGSCLGAFLTTIFLIPILGISKTCYAVGTVNFAVLTLLIVSSKHKMSRSPR